MSQLSQANAKKRTPSQWLSLALISAVFGALLLVMLSGTVSAQSSDPIGRGFTGVATINDGEASLTVESKGEVFTLTITDDTVIHNPPVKGGEKACHCGGGIVYRRHDEKGLNWEPGGIRSGAGVRSSGVSQESTGSSDTWEAALCRLCLRR